MLLANLVMGGLFSLEFQWYVESVDCFAPWVSFVSYECQIVTTINVLGALVLHVGAPLAQGRSETLGAPRGFAAKRRTNGSAVGRPLSLGRFA